MNRFRRETHLDKDKSMELELQARRLQQEHCASQELGFRLTGQLM
jgi:hypothetical protein